MRDLRHAGHILTNLGAIYGKLSQFAEAAEYLQEALTRYREIGDVQDECSILIALGEVMIEIGELRAAQRHWREALLICENLGYKRTAEVRLRLAELDSQNP